MTASSANQGELAMTTAYLNMLKDKVQGAKNDKAGLSNMPDLAANLQKFIDANEPLIAVFQAAHDTGADYVSNG